MEIRINKIITTSILVREIYNKILRITSNIRKDMENNEISNTGFTNTYNNILAKKFINIIKFTNYTKN